MKYFKKRIDKLETDYLYDERMTAQVNKINEIIDYINRDIDNHNEGLKILVDVLKDKKWVIRSISM